jgi:hypothetical protein
MIAILTILFMLFIWTLCRISKKEVPRIQKNRDLSAFDEEKESDFDISTSLK